MEFNNGHLKSTLAPIYTRPTDPHEHSTCCRFHFIVLLLQNYSCTSRGAKGSKKRTNAKLYFTPRCRDTRPHPIGAVCSGITRGRYGALRHRAILSPRPQPHPPSCFNFQAPPRLSSPDPYLLRVAASRRRESSVSVTHKNECF